MKLPVVLKPASVLASLVLAAYAIGQESPAPVAEKGPLRLRVPAGARFEFGGFLGERIEANLRNWLLVAPRANPGMTEMFRRRESARAPQLVDWAGEFAGKYLISAVQARRMVASPELDGVIRRLVDELLAAQAEDGYLGVFKKDERLLAHWDLWNHYHVMLGLLMVAEEMDYTPAYEAACKAADLICHAYLDGKRRVFDAGSHEMNMAVIHVLGRLYRLTGRERYLQMMRHIEEDWQRAGDYFRTGLAGLDYYRTPRPRWESLHDLQGLVELHRITGNADYSRAFSDLWTSILRYDRHNSGSFSTGEGAVGSPYRPGSIETCCTIAWMAISVDMLALTGDPRVADELELSTYNAVPASQHPTGRWWTYDTPMDGRREASTHTIVFQARAGTPELNCCSVNGPRGLGMLSEWAVLVDADGPVVNHYGPSTAHFRLGSGRRLTLVQETRYPAEGAIKLVVRPELVAEFTLRLRIPAWSTETKVRVNGQPVADVKAGSYCPIRRRWEPGDTVEIAFDMTPRYWAGQQDVAGRASIYRGPLLLAFDEHHNAYDCGAIPKVDVRKLDLKPASTRDVFATVTLFDLASTEGRPLRLCDFATAGAHGTEYRSWLPAIGALPPAPELRTPPPGGRVPPGPIRFEWVGFPSNAPEGTTYDLLAARDGGFREMLFEVKALVRTRYHRREPLVPGSYFWKVVARNPAGTVDNLSGSRQFTVDANLPPSPPALLTEGEDRVVVRAELDGTDQPAYGKLAAANNIEPAPDRQGRSGRALRFNGRDSRVQYAIAAFPDEDYTVCAWIWVERFSAKTYQQVFSAWCRPADDPLRLCVMGDSIQARIEAGQTYATPAVKIETGRWIHVAAVKQGDELRLYVNGEPGEAARVPEFIETAAHSVAIGANPSYAGDEYFDGRIDDFLFCATALPAERIRQIADVAARAPQR